VQEVQNQAGDLVEQVIRTNIRHVVGRLRTSWPVLRPHLMRGQIRILGAYYSLRTGVVEWLSS
jgi:carbonic anhydrase